MLKTFKITISIIFFGFIFQSCMSGCMSDSNVPDDSDLPEDSLEIVDLTLDQEKDSLLEIQLNDDLSEKEKELAKRRAEVIDSAQRHSTEKDKTCDEILEKFEKLISDFVTKGKNDDHVAILQLQRDPYFSDCRMQESFALRIKEGVDKINRYLDAKESND